MSTSRFDVFTVGELQALTYALSAASALTGIPRSPWDHPVWARLAREVTDTLARAALDETWDEGKGTEVSEVTT